MRIGYGCDTHRLQEGRPLILGGVFIRHDKGLLGHSDADVLAHAVVDALLGAAALGDIGAHFPDTDAAFAGANSMELLEKTVAMVKAAGYRVENIDAVVLAQKPKLLPYMEQIRQSLAGRLEIDVNQVSVKAKTNEGMDAVGRCEGMEARCVCLLEKAI